MKAFYVWKDHLRRTSHAASVDMQSLAHAIQFGTSQKALYFKVEGEPGRRYTSGREVISATDAIEYLTYRNASGFGPGMLAGMFSRTTQDSDSTYTNVSSLNSAVESLGREAQETRFLLTQDGGFIKLSADDTAYDRKGLQIWPEVQSETRLRGRFSL